MRIVYIDDDELLLQVAEVVLESSGCVVTCVNDPLLAPRTVLEVDPDIVLLDVMMPGRDGLQTLDDLRRAGAVDRAPVVFVTGDAAAEDRRRLICAGAAGVIAKPFAPQTLAEDLRRLHQEWRVGAAAPRAGAHALEA